jgi:RHS repeat-associated protein
LKHKGYNNVTSSNGNSTAQKFGFGGKELNEELGLNLSDYHARQYDPTLGRMTSMDPHSENYYPLTPYNYGANTPLIATDPNGKDVIIIIWSTDRKNRRYGHAGIAVSNYKTVNKTDAKGNVIKDKNGNAVTEQVEDGTYTYYDLWPGKDTNGDGSADDFGEAGPNLKDSFLGMIGLYQKKKINSLNDIINGDPSGAEGYAPNGVIRLNAGFEETQETIDDLESHIKFNRNYKSATNNCSDFCKSGIGEALDIYPGLIRGTSESYLNGNMRITTPNQLYKYLTKKIKNNPSEGKVLKSAGGTVKEKFTSNKEIKGN